MRILVIEDNIKLNGNIADILMFEGYEVFSATTLTEAKVVNDVYKPSIILLDIMLPDGDSYSEISGFREGKNTYIIMLTALEGRDMKRICYESGADDYITKPFSLEELLLKINAIKRRIITYDTIVKVGDVELDRKKKTITAVEKELISPVLFEIFEILCDNYLKAPDKPVCYKIEAYDKSRVQTAINRLRNHLYDCGSKNVVIKNIYKQGYILEVRNE